MTQTPLDRGRRPWADPFWWAGQQLKLVTATATYFSRVAEAGIGAVIPALREIERPETAAPAPAPASAPSEPEPPQAEVTAPEPESPEPEPELPVAGWDELSLGSIRARLSRLSEADLVILHAYEERHGDRADVLSMLANRLIKIQAS